MYGVSCVWSWKKLKRRNDASHKTVQKSHKLCFEELQDVCVCLSVLKINIVYFVPAEEEREQSPQIINFKLARRTNTNTNNKRRQQHAE